MKNGITVKDKRLFTIYKKALSEIIVSLLETTLKMHYTLAVSCLGRIMLGGYLYRYIWER